MLYYQVKETSDARQLFRTSVICSGAAYLIGLKGDNSGVNLVATIAFAVLLAPEMTPFATSLALLLNLTQYHCQIELWSFAVLQALTIGLGGAYELIVLSDYGNR